MKRTQLKGIFCLLLTAFIWGIAFVAQSVGLENVGPFTFSSVRMILGVAALLPFIFIRDRIAVKKLSENELSSKKAADKKAVLYGVILGVVFCFAGNFQQYALIYSSPGKVAFITATYIFFVPLLGLLFRKKISLVTWICVVMCFVGLYFLCIDPANIGKLNIGDILALVCAIFFAVHILLVEKFAPDVDGLKLSCIQFAVSGVISSILMFIFENPQWTSIVSAAVPLLYAGILSSGVAYTLQIIGQKYTESTIATLVMCMESVFAVLAAAVILSEKLTGREIAGCLIMFAAIILPQIFEIWAKKVSERSCG